VLLAASRAPVSSVATAASCGKWDTGGCEMEKAQP